MHWAARCGLVLALHIGQNGWKGCWPAIAHNHHFLSAEHTCSAGLHLVSRRVAAPLPSSIAHLCQFCRRFVHGRPTRASAWSACTKHDSLLFLGTCHHVISKLAPPPQRTGSSIVALQTPCPEPDSSAGPSQPTAQDPVGRFQPRLCPPPTGLPRAPSWLRAPPQPWRNHQLQPPAVSRSAFAAKAVTSSGWAPWSGLPSAPQIVVTTALCKSTAD